MWPQNINLSDLQSAASWSIDANSGYVVVHLTGKFPQGDVGFAIVERQEGGYNAIQELAPAKHS
jgi:hypothetical protein